MSEPLSLSIFTIEADRKPILAFAAKKCEEAETFFRDEGLRTKFRLTISGGVSLCDGLTILRLRLANAAERALFREGMASKAAGDLDSVFFGRHRQRIVAYFGTLSFLRCYHGHDQECRGKKEEAEAAPDGQRCTSR
jgi:hypothetical protein